MGVCSHTRRHCELTLKILMSLFANYLWENKKGRRSSDVMLQKMLMSLVFLKVECHKASAVIAMIKVWWILAMPDSNTSLSIRSNSLL